MNEYALEEGKEVDLHKLEVSFIEPEIFTKIHSLVPIVCHDIAIELNGGFLLVKRDNLPVKNNYFVIGGRINRGFSIIKSLQQKVQEECGLSVNDIRFLGCARTFFKTDPFGHGKGTDTINLMFYGKGSGKLHLDHLHKKPIFVTPSMYSSEFRATLHPYIQEILDKAFKIRN